MKQEANNIIKLVEHKYGFDLCEKTEFVKQMIKEFTKYEKKLAKIYNYEKMLAEGKILNKEVQELIGKKQSFIDHLRSLKEVTDIYVKTSSKYTEAVEAIKDNAEAEKEVKKFREEELKKLSDFLIMAKMLNEKDHISPTPLTRVPKEKQEDILNCYTKLTKLTHNKDITMRGEAESLRKTIYELLTDKDMTEHIERTMGSALIADVKFRISEGLEYEFVMLQPADKLKINELIKIELPKVHTPLNKIEEDKIIEADEEEYDRKLLNHCYVLRDN